MGTILYGDWTNNGEEKTFLVTHGYKENLMSLKLNVITIVQISIISF